MYRPRRETAIHAETNKTVQITELRDAKAESERQTAILSKELQDTKDILHMRNVMLHHNQCDQQVFAHMLWQFKACSALGMQGL